MAKDRILRSHMGLVIHVVKVFYRPSAFMEFSDLVQQGCLGLLHAIEKFDPNRRSRGRQVQFQTYAQYWVSHSIRRAIQNHGRLVAVPIARQREIPNNVVSLDSTPNRDNDDRFCEQIADMNESPETWCRDWEARFCVEELLARLPERKQAILRSRYGLSGSSGPGTQKQIGEQFGITGAFIGYLERTALQSLREAALTIR